MHSAKTRSEVLDRARDYNARGLAVSISYLPVPSFTKAAVQKTIAEYAAVLDDIQSKQLDADITIKPQQFGTNISKRVACQALLQVSDIATAHGRRTWFDQELRSSISIMHEVALSQEPEEVGICVQAFRRRSKKDVEKCAGFPIRLVKGFYKDFDISPWSAVTKNYLALMDEVIKYSSYPCFATHDPACIEKAKTLLRENNFVGEIQFFAGVRDELAEELVKEGYRVRIYLPYGHLYAFLWHGLPIFDRVRALKRVLGYKKIT